MPQTPEPRDEAERADCQSSYEDVVTQLETLDPDRHIALDAAIRYHAEFGQTLDVPLDQILHTADRLVEWLSRTDDLDAELASLQAASAAASSSETA